MATTPVYGLRYPAPSDPVKISPQTNDADLALDVEAQMVANDSFGKPIFAVCAADQLVTNSTTLVSSVYLTFTLAAGRTYEIDANLVMQATTTTGNIKTAWAVTGTVAAAITSGNERMVQGPPDTGTSLPDSTLVQTRAFALAAAPLYTMNTANSNYYAHERLLVVGGASGGTLTLQFAQNTGVAANSAKLMANSYATARRVL